MPINTEFLGDTKCDTNVIQGDTERGNNDGSGRKTVYKEYFFQGLSVDG